MANLSGFNAMDVEPNTGFELIPAGDYRACIVASGMKATKDGNGSYLDLQIQILGGPYQNRTLFEKLNLKNQSEKAVAIAKATLSSICRACNVLTPSDSADLHGIPFVISVGTRKREDNGEMVNRIKSFKKDGLSAPPESSSGIVPASSKPW